MAACEAISAVTQDGGKAESEACSIVLFENRSELALRRQKAIMSSDSDIDSMAAISVVSSSLYGAFRPFSVSASPATTYENVLRSAGDRRYSLNINSLADFFATTKAIGLS